MSVNKDAYVMMRNSLSAIAIERSHAGQLAKETVRLVCEIEEIEKSAEKERKEAARRAGRKFVESCINQE